MIDSNTVQTTRLTTPFDQSATLYRGCHQFLVDYVDYAIKKNTRERVKPLSKDLEFHKEILDLCNMWQHAQSRSDPESGDLLLLTANNIAKYWFEENAMSPEVASLCPQILRQTPIIRKMCRRDAPVFSRYY